MIGGFIMGKVISKKGAKWPEQIPVHVQSVLDCKEEDYSLKDVISLCEEIIELYVVIKAGGWRPLGMEFVCQSL